MSWLTALKLGRVSNLPTVWSNSLAGTVLAGGSVYQLNLWQVMFAMSLYYIGGMYLNDAFDAEIDKRERPERPIPAGLVSRRVVFIVGFALLFAGQLVLVDLGTRAAIVGLVLAAAIVVYNLHHKNNPISPLIMGVCRVCIYLAAGFAVASELSMLVVGAALMLLCYLIGLTYVAKKENLLVMQNTWPLAFLALPVGYSVWLAQSWIGLLFSLGLAAWIVVSLRFILSGKKGGIGKGVVSLIAGIALLDAALISALGHVAVALVAVVFFALTLLLQRVVPGT